jgi:hypothetical protein
MVGGLRGVGGGGVFKVGLQIRLTANETTLNFYAYTFLRPLSPYFCAGADPEAGSGGGVHFYLLF